MIKEEKLNANYLSFIKYLEKYNCYSEQMINDIGEQIKVAPYSTTLEFGGAEPGGLIDVTLNVLCKIGAEINQNVLGGKEQMNHPYLCVNLNQLMKVLLLVNISKAVTFIPNPSQWHRDKLGKIYDFAEQATKLKLGQRSIFLCQKYGIVLEEVEYEAFLALDSNVDEIGSCYQSPLYTLVKITKMLTELELYRKYKASLVNNSVEK